MPIVKVKDMTFGNISLPNGKHYVVKDGQFKADNSDIQYLQNENIFNIVPEQRIVVEKENVIDGKVVSEERLSEAQVKPGKVAKVIQTSPKKKK